MTELNDYTFDEFLHLNVEEREQYKQYGIYSKANGFGLPEVLEWEWGKVQQIRDLINQERLSYIEMIEILCIAYDKAKEEILLKKWHEVFKMYNFVSEEISRVNEFEKELNYEPEASEINAGIDEFRQFGWFTTLYRLSGGDPLKYEAIGKMSYSDIFATLKLQRVDNEFNRRLMRQKHV